jgi:hypothetical protein
MTPGIDVFGWKFSTMAKLIQVRSSQYFFKEWWLIILHRRNYSLELHSPAVYSIREIDSTGGIAVA